MQRVIVHLQRQRDDATIAAAMAEARASQIAEENQKLKAEIMARDKAQPRTPE